MSSAYFRLIRPHWTIASTLAATAGIFQAWSEGYSKPWLAAVVVAAAFTSHAFMEVWDEIKDFQHYRNEFPAESSDPLTLFSGGSGVLTGRRLRMESVRRFFWTLLVVYAVLLGVIISQVGWRFLLCVAVGFFFLFGYNAVVKLSYNGLGELANFVAFGPILVCSAYLALRLGSGADVTDTGSWNLVASLDLQVVAVSVVLGVIWFGSLHVQEMLDLEEDAAGGKRTLVVRYGREYAARVPWVTAIVVVGLLCGLAVDRPLYLVALPAAILHAVETFRFMRRWRDHTYFMRKMSDFFVYRNFVLIGSSMLLATALLPTPPGVDPVDRWLLVACAVVSFLPAAFWLSGNGVFRWRRHPQEPERIDAP